MSTILRPRGFVYQVLAAAAVLSVGASRVSAQSPSSVAGQADAPQALAPAQSNVNLNIPAGLQFPVFSSSSSAQGTPVESLVASTATPFQFADAMQYGQRRRYGRPRYRGGNTNEDGSEKYTFVAGAGFTQPIGNTYHYFTPSYGIEVGGGRNFNKNLGVLIQFDYDHFGLNGRTLSEQSYLYTGDATASDNGIDANAHVWSFSIDPTYTIAVNEGLGAYLVAGVGFYHKVTNFTSPQAGEYYDPYYGPVEYEANTNFDHYTSNAPGFNGGFGLTYKFSRFSHERLFGEIRYVVTLNSQRTGYTYANIATTTYNGNNAFPANSNRTTYLPVKFGLRF